MTCYGCVCAKHSIIVGSVCISLFVLVLGGFLMYYMCKYFGVRYVFRGGYHYDRHGDKGDVLLLPIPFVPGKFQKRNASSIFSAIYVAIGLPKCIESSKVALSSEELGRQMKLPGGVSIEPIWGTDGKVYAMFLHYAQLKITLLCWINLRYMKQWRCLVDTKLVEPFFLDKSAEFTGKCWSCVAHFYKLVRANLWKAWRERFCGCTSQLVITGHSLGGAMAPVAALDFRVHDDRLGSDNLFVYVSGAPRCGDVQFADQYNELLPNTWNIMNTYDLITLTPPIYSNTHKYAHAGNEVYITHAHPDGLWASHLMKTYVEHFNTDGKIRV
jgi:hypothetical protein